MTKTKYTGVYAHTAKDGTKTFHIRGKISGRNYTEVVGSTKEGITAMYASTMRAKKHSIIKHGVNSPHYREEVYTLTQASELYFNSIKHKSNTENMKAVYNKHIKKHNNLGNNDLATVTVNDLKLFQAAKLNEKSIKTDRYYRYYSKATVNKIIDMVSAIYNYMIEYHDVKVENPCRKVKRFKVDNKRERYLEQSEIQALLDDIVNDTKRIKGKELRLFVLLALTTGARLTSILNVTKADINLNTNQITLKDYKRDMTYQGYIHDDVRELLQEGMQGLRPIDYVIGGKVKAMSKESMNKMLQPTLNKLFNDGLDAGDAKRRVVIHSLRHTFASHLAINNVPIFTIQKLLNHAEIEQTMRYAKLAPNQGEADIMKIKISH